MCNYLIRVYSQVNITSNSSVFIFNKNDHLVWEITKLFKEVFTTDSEMPFSEVRVSFTLVRRPTYFNHMFVAPAVTLAFLLPVIFLIPAQSGEKITLGESGSPIIDQNFTSLV